MISTMTQFAPAERASAESISRDAETLRRSGLDEHVTYVLPMVLMILNRERQAVYANRKLLSFLEVSSEKDVLGQRPGELLDCIHAHASLAGCGTTEFCRECGAVRAILKSQQEQVGTEAECRITSTSGEAYEFAVWASPYELKDTSYTIFTLNDIRNEKRRQVLEQTFFHDVDNILQTLLGYAEILELSDPESKESWYANAVKSSSLQLVDEIDSQRRMLDAENGNLALHLSTIQSRLLLEDLKKSVSATRKWGRRLLVIDRKIENFEFTSDRALLLRVLRNMVKNALEATSDDQEIKLSCITENGMGFFYVENPGSIPRPVQLQIFQRSFSTKGKGRGIGTYSMKLFGEKYLKGHVTFAASGEKTVFCVSVPLQFPEEEDS